jgi:anti-anti-sigma factor
VQYPLRERRLFGSAVSATYLAIRLFCEMNRKGARMAESRFPLRDLATASACRADLRRTIESSSGAVVVDCHELTFIDASGISLLVETCRRLSERGRGFRLANVPPFFERVLKTLDLHDELHAAPADHPSLMHRYATTLGACDRVCGMRSPLTPHELRICAIQEASDLGPEPLDPRQRPAWRQERSVAVALLAALADADASLLRRATIELASEWTDRTVSGLLLEAAQEC